MLEGEKIEVSVDGKKVIKVKDSEISKGQIALITEQRLPLTVIDDFVVRPIGKKGTFSKKQNEKESQAIAQSLPASNHSSTFETFDYPSLKEHGKREKGPNTDYEENSYSSVLSSELSAVSPESPEPVSPFSPFSHFSPEPDPIYQTTSSLPPSELLLYYHHDHLGNIRVVTDQNRNVVERHDFYPFGEEVTTPQSKDQYLFTGKPRDSETGLDYFGKRYYSSSLCRWMSTDPQATTKASLKDYLENPQTWNLYIYCDNNPIVLVDPEGEAPVLAPVSKEQSIQKFIVQKLFGWAPQSVQNFITSMTEPSEFDVLNLVAPLGVLTKAEQLTINKIAGKAAEQKVAKELVEKGEKFLSQVRVGSSRIDFLLEGRAIEVKATDWTSKSYKSWGNVKEMLKGIVRQVGKHQRDLGMPEKVLFANKPKDPALVKKIEDFFRKRNITVIWDLTVK